MHDILHATNNWMTYLLIFAVVAYFFIFRAKGNYTIKDYKKSDLKPYRLGKSILTGPELIFYRVLRKHLNQDYILGTKIRIADFVNVKRVKKDGKQMSTLPAFNRISSKHADFMICAMNGKPLAWIELDDKSHGTKSAQKADRFKDDVAKKVGIPIYRVKTGTNYNEAVSSIKMALR